MTKRALITGSTGFVGYHLVLWLLDHTDWDIVGLDSFRHAGDSLRVHVVPRHRIFCHDLNAPIGKRLARAIGPVDYVINLASISHVDDSITDPVVVWENNTRLIGNALEYAREAGVEAFIQCSTDEVFGPAASGFDHGEWDTICPSNPYSASKAAQEALCMSYWRTYGLPLVITNCMNMVGERQEPTKYLPRIIRAVSLGEEVVVHGSPERVGSRMYLDARNLADAWLFLIRNHKPYAYIDGPDIQRPSRFNIVGVEEVSNLELARRVAAIMGKPLRYRFEDFHSVRPGHDRRYALDGAKLAALGWRHPITLDDTLRRVIAWTLAHPEWMADN